MKKWIYNGEVSKRGRVMKQYTCPKCGRVSDFADKPEDTCPWCGEKVEKPKKKDE